VPHPARRIEEEIARIDKRDHPVKLTAEPDRTRSALQLAGCRERNNRPTLEVEQILD
jgi:hypothetical protein